MSWCLSDLLKSRFFEHKLFWRRFSKRQVTVPLQYLLPSVTLFSLLFHSVSLISHWFPSNSIGCEWVTVGVLMVVSSVRHDLSPFHKKTTISRLCIENGKSHKKCAFWCHGVCGMRTVFRKKLICSRAQLLTLLQNFEFAKIHCVPHWNID